MSGHRARKRHKRLIGLLLARRRGIFAWLALSSFAGIWASAASRISMIRASPGEPQRKAAAIAEAITQAAASQGRAAAFWRP